LVWSSIPKMETRSCVTSVDFQRATWRHITAVDSILHYATCPALPHSNLRRNEAWLTDPRR
jgi:hypothetical protein